MTDNAAMIAATARIMEMSQDDARRYVDAVFGRVTLTTNNEGNMPVKTLKLSGRMRVIDLEPRRAMHAADMSRADARAYRAAYRLTATAHACEHGHADCAAYDDGPCLDELLNAYPDLAD